MNTEFSYRCLGVVRDGQQHPMPVDNGYDIYATVTYDQKTWYYGLTGESEYADFCKWAAVVFDREIDNGADIALHAKITPGIQS